MDHLKYKDIVFSRLFDCRKKCWPIEIHQKSCFTFKSNNFDDNTHAPFQWSVQLSCHKFRIALSSQAKLLYRQRTKLFTKKKKHTTKSAADKWRRIAFALFFVVFPLAYYMKYKYISVSNPFHYLRKVFIICMTNMQHNCLKRTQTYIFLKI